MEGSFGGERGQVLMWWHDDESRDVMHMSFYKWVQTVVIAMERSVLPYNAVGGYDEYEAVLREVNPGYPKMGSAGE